MFTTFDSNRTEACDVRPRAKQAMVNGSIYFSGSDPAVVKTQSVRSSLKILLVQYRVNRCSRMKQVVLDVQEEFM